MNKKVFKKFKDVFKKKVQSSPIKEEEKTLV